MARQPYLAQWLEWARPAYQQLEALGVPAARRHLEAVRSNVLLQRQNLDSYGCVRDALTEGRLQVHAWLFDLEMGDLMAHDDDEGEWMSISREFG